MVETHIRFVAAVVALTFAQHAAVQAAKTAKSPDDVVSVGRCGISFRPPKNWFVNDPKQIEANIGKLDSKTEDISTLLASRRGSIDIASYAKHDPRGHAGLIPTIKVIGRANPTTSFEGLTEMIRANSVAIGSTLRNYAIKTDVTERTVSGRRVMFFVAEFDLATAAGGSYRVTSTTYVIPCDRLFLQVSMSESVPAKDEQVFAAFIASFAFAQP